MCQLNVVVFLFGCLSVFALEVHALALKNSTQTLRCHVPDKAPKDIERVIETCQEEIKDSIVFEALESLNEDELKALHDTLNVQSVQSRRKRSAIFDDDERRIAGCLLLCVFRKKNALNKEGLPVLEGLVNLYAESATDKSYVLATIQAVHFCLNKTQKTTIKGNVNVNACDVAYDVFNCVSDKIVEFCGQTP